MPARDVDNLMFLETCRDVYYGMDTGVQMPECFPYALRAAYSDLLEASIALESAEALCKSPIEKALLREMFAEWRHGTGWAFRLVGKNTAFVNQDGGPHVPKLTLSIQHQIDQYTADFAVQLEFDGHTSPLVVVECDGHAFHERTKEQAAHDRARDRHMTAADIRVMRFTGSQIYQDPTACVNEVLGLLFKLEKSLRRESARGR